MRVCGAGEQADLIFVFFDPMGQALCKRTLNIVEKLSEKCGDKLRFYLSKADEAGRETDRQVGGAAYVCVCVSTQEVEHQHSVCAVSFSVSLMQNKILPCSRVISIPLLFSSFFCLFTESYDADSSRAVPQTGTQQMRL